MLEVTDFLNNAFICLIYIIITQNIWLISGKTPLMLAAERNDIDFVELVINVHNKTFFLTTAKRYTALHHAVQNNNIPITKCILTHCKSPSKLINMKCKPDGDTALDIAYSKENAEILMLLVLHGADVDRPMRNWILKIGMIQNVCEETMEEYLNVDLDPNYIDGGGRTFLHMALRSNLDNWILGLDVNATNSSGDTPMHILLNDLQIRPQAQQNIDLTKWIAQRLMDFNADVTKLNNVGVSAAVLASRISSSLFKMLLPNIPLAADLNKQGEKLIHLLAKQKLTQQLRDLLQWDCPGNINDQDKSGNTPLMFAAAQNHQDMVELLLENGADVSVVGRLGSALHRLLNTLASKNVDETLKLLLDAQGLHNIINVAHNFSTPLDVAYNKCRANCFKMLLGKGAILPDRSYYSDVELAKMIQEGMFDKAHCLIAAGVSCNGRVAEGNLISISSVNLTLIAYFRTYSKPGRFISCV